LLYGGRLKGASDVRLDLGPIFASEPLAKTNKRESRQPHEKRRPGHYKPGEQACRQVCARFGCSQRTAENCKRKKEQQESETDGHEDLDEHMEAKRPAKLSPAGFNSKLATEDRRKGVAEEGAMAVEDHAIWGDRTDDGLCGQGTHRTSRCRLGQRTCGGFRGAGYIEVDFDGAVEFVSKALQQSPAV
jgi:hypothetical protein